MSQTLPASPSGQFAASRVARVTQQPSFDHLPGTSAAEHLSPTYPERAPWGLAGKLRAWQEEAIEKYLDAHPRDYLVAATPGAGKTTFALRLAAALKAKGLIDRITIVAPTEHLKIQWADAAARAGLKINPRYSNSDGTSYGRQFIGAAVTYAQVAAKPMLHRRLTEAANTLVILDEIHHGGDALSWGEAIRTAFDPATRRLSLTGTPFRSDSAPIPFVQYARDGSGQLISRTDFDFGYTRALADGIVRPVVFLVYAGEMRWQTSTGEVMDARLGEGNTKSITAQAWRTALDPHGSWMQSVLNAAHKRLLEVRHSVHDAGGLVIATDQDSARAYAQILERISGNPVTVVLSDDAGSSAKIDDFSHSDSFWMVAVRMVSEGVDVPRLSVGVYATSSSTPLFFAQAIGRFVRSRRRGEIASVFIPNVPTLMQLANELEKQRDHVIDLSSEGSVWLSSDDEAPSLDEDALDNDEESFQFVPITSDANFDRVIYEGEEFGGYAAVESLEELDFLGLPGVLEPDQVKTVLQQRHERQSRRRDRSIRASTRQRADGSREHSSQMMPHEPIHRTLREQRKLLNSLVSLVAKLNNEPHGHVHARLRRQCGGPQVSQASVTQLQQRIDALRKQLAQ